MFFLVNSVWFCYATEDVCKSNDNIYKPVPDTNCTKFIQFTEDGDSGIHECPEGLLFDTKVCGCNWSEDVECLTP